MPELDRRVTIRIVSTGTNSFGESTEVTTDHPAWAILAQDSVARSLDAGGVYALAARTWRVRFNQAILDAHAAGQSITVVYGSEAPDIVKGVGEPTDRGPLRRRRFLDMTT